MALNLIYTQHISWRAGDIKQLVVSAQSQSELSSARLALLQTNVISARLHCLTGSFYVSATKDVAPSTNNVLLEEGEYVEITTGDEVKNCRFRGAEDGSMVIHYYGGGNSI